MPNPPSRGGGITRNPQSNPHPIRFRTANVADLPGIIALGNEVFGENTKLSEAKKIFRKYEYDENQIYLIGELGGQIIAHAKITIIPTIYDEMGTYAILNHICVKPEYRRAHIGTKLLDHCFAIAKKHGCKKVELWSLNFRTAAHAMYKKYGFEVVDCKFFAKEIEKGGK